MCTWAERGLDIFGKEEGGGGITKTFMVIVMAAWIFVITGNLGEEC